MAQKYINIGTFANDGTGDVMRVCFTKTDNNFSELYFTTANLTSNLSNLSTAVDVFEGYVYTQLGAISNTANAAYLQSNNANAVAQAAFQLANTANQAWLAANAAYSYANGVATVTNGRVNTIYLLANSAFDSVNSVGIYANTINTSLNGINGVRANAAGAFDKANLSYTYASAAFDEANIGLTLASSVSTSVNNLGAYANNINSTLGSAFGVANAAFGVANSDLSLINSVYYLTNAAFGKANSGYTLAAAAIPAYNGTATGTLSAVNFSTSGSASFAGYHTIDGNGAVFRTGNNNYGVRIYAGGYGIDTTKTQLQFYSSDQSTQYGYIGANSSSFWVGSVANLPTNIMVNGSAAGVFSTTGLTVTGQIWATDNITAYNTSDIKLKKNIKKISDALNKIKQISGVEYDWIDEYINEQGGEDGYFVRKHDVGVIAQEVEVILPEVVAERKDGTKAVKYDKLVPLLIEAIKELSDEVERLKNGISK